MSFVRFAVASVAIATAVVAHAAPGSREVVVDYKEAPNPPAMLKRAPQIHHSFSITDNGKESHSGSWADTPYAQGCVNGRIKPGDVKTGYAVSLALHHETSRALVLHLNYEILDLQSLPEIQAGPGCLLQQPRTRRRAESGVSVTVPLSGDPVTYPLSDGAELIFRMLQ